MAADDAQGFGRLGRLEREAARGLQILVGAIMLAGVVLNCGNVVARYLFLRPFIWAEEAMQFLNVWAVMMGAAIITWMGSHLRMDAVYLLVPARARRRLRVLNNVIAVAIIAYVVVQAAGMVRMLAGTGQRSVIAGVPMSAMYTAVLLGFTASGLFLLAWLTRAARGSEVEAGEAAGATGPA